MISNMTSLNQTFTGIELSLPVEDLGRESAITIFPLISFSGLMAQSEDSMELQNSVRKLDSCLADVRIIPYRMGELASS